MFIDECGCSGDLERTKQCSGKTSRIVYGVVQRERALKRFEETYGKGSIKIFKRIIEDTNYSLADVARYFGFSRENARLVYRKIYGVPYTGAYHKKLEERRYTRENLRQKETRRAKGKRMFYVNRVRKKAESFGLIVLSLTVGNPNSLLINGCKINVKGTSRTIRVGKNAYFNMSKTNLKQGDCDFFICVCTLMGKETYYIIPYDHMPKCGAYIPVNNHFFEDDTCFIHEGNKYLKFRETWELLKGENRNKKYAIG